MSGSKVRLVVFLAVVLVGISAALVFKPKPGRGQTVAQTFLFTWPGDDGNVGTASSLDLRWSRNEIVGTDTLSWWNSATRWTGAYPTPKVAGTADSVIVLGLPSDTPVVVIVKACDEVPNCSGYSNVARGRTKDFVPPGRVTDLRFGFAPNDAIAGPGASAMMVILAAERAARARRAAADPVPPSPPILLTGDPPAV